ncbi:hypothetical protein ACI7YT_12455 [Microbacterium sp. M]|uniref:hypothetical protein n=1 Tax=Microbacterium sp. M TaxID=3377125 RepID=UPI003865D04E
MSAATVERHPTLDAGRAGGEAIFHELRRLWMEAPKVYAGPSEKADHEEAFDRFFNLIPRRTA